LVPCDRLSWLLPAFDRTLISHSYLLSWTKGCKTVVVVVVVVVQRVEAVIEEFERGCQCVLCDGL